jgi:GntR family transcriptional regulator
MSTILQNALDGDNRLPLYQRLADTIRKDVVSGAYKPGDRVPSENVFSRELKIAPGTVRQALAQLVEEGILERMHGKGTFVRSPNFDDALFRFFRMRGEQGEVLMPESEILSRELEIFPDQIVELFEAHYGIGAINMHRLRNVGGETVMVEDIWLPRDPFQDFLKVPLDEIGALLYPAYANICGLVIVDVKEAITVEKADHETAKMLQIEPSEPIVIIERTAFGYEGNPLEWRRSKGRASQFQYHVEIR